MAIGPLGSERPPGLQVETGQLKNGAPAQAARDVAETTAASVSRQDRQYEDRLEIGTPAPHCGDGRSATYSKEEILGGAAQSNRRELGSNAGGTVNAAGDKNRTEKLDQVRDRVRGGYYDRPEVKQEIAARIAEELDSIANNDD